MWSMEGVVIPTIIGALVTARKSVVSWLEESGIGGRNKTINATTMLRWAKIMRRILATRGDLLWNSSEIPCLLAGMEDLLGLR